MIYINDLTFEEMKEYIKKIGEKPFRAEQLFRFFNSEKKLNLNESSNLPKSLRDLDVSKIKIHKIFNSELDETKKFLFSLDDGNLIEGVLMKYKYGYAQCISTQVGCRMNCSFCASTKKGLVRNLRPSEMLGQIYQVEKAFDINVSNVILMGSGEPFDNFDNLLKFLEIIHDEKGHNMSYKNITISTCGISPKIYELADYNKKITLALSLHNPFNEERKKIMPIAKKYDINEVIKACKYYEEKTGTRVTFEYTLIDGVNNKDAHANELSKLLKGMRSHLNIIPLNPIEEYQEKRPDRKKVEDFKNKMNKLGLNATIRRELGSDISASCGQLKRSSEVEHWK